MKQMSLMQIAAACGGTYYGGEEAGRTEVTGITSDSRMIEPGFLFAALKGERVDGHRFIPQAFEKGALCVLAEQAPADSPGPYILVQSCYQALKDIAGYYRKALGITVVGIGRKRGKDKYKGNGGFCPGTKYRCRDAGQF